MRFTLKNLSCYGLNAQWLRFLYVTVLPSAGSRNSGTIPVFIADSLIVILFYNNDKLLFCARRTLIKIHSKICEYCALYKKVCEKSTIKFMAVLVFVIVRWNNCFHCCKCHCCSIMSAKGLRCSVLVWSMRVAKCLNADAGFMGINIKL